MTEQEQIEQLKEANETWRKRWASERYEVEQLKAQVNCLREVLEQLAKLGNGDKYGNSIGNTIAINALAKTPEQCLAKVKAKAIGDMQLKLTPHTIDGNAYYRAGDVAMHTSQLRGQISVSEQLDLATKIMTVTI